MHFLEKRSDKHGERNEADEVHLNAPRLKAVPTKKKRGGSQAV